MIKLERLNSVSVMTSNVGSTHMTPREDYVRLSDATTYGDQRAAEAREQMREECVKLFNEISKAAWAKWLVECDPHQRGVSMGANACEKVIKELK